MQAARMQSVENDGASVESRELFRRLFATYWDDVQHLNSYSPEAARALLRLEGNAGMIGNPFPRTAEEVASFVDQHNDPWLAVRAGLQERAAGRLLTRGA